MADSTKTLTILGNSKQLTFKDSVNVLDFLNANEVSINQSCGGNGTCTTCRFFILEGDQYLAARTEIEIERAIERNFLNHERLACQCELSGSAVIKIPEN